MQLRAFHLVLIQSSNFSKPQCDQKMNGTCPGLPEYRKSETAKSKNDTSRVILLALSVNIYVDYDYERQKREHIC